MYKTRLSYTDMSYNLPLLKYIIMNTTYSKYFPAFTLVELIVVITIVWILSTVWFVSYSGYLTWARDSNRISQMVKLSDSLQVYASTKSLPLPDDYIKITSSGSSDVIAYQWYIWVDVLETIDYTNGGTDPKDDSYYTYYLTKDRKKIQLLAFMEETLAWNILPNIQSSTYAANYEDRSPKVYGQKLWVLVSAEESTLNTPAQEIAANKTAWYLSLATAPQSYSAIYSNDGDILTASGYTLYGLAATRLWEKAPSECPEWFIWVPWNPEFDTEEWFCVAQYEMTYSDADVPNSTEAGTEWNTVAFVLWKQIVSQAWKYPIASINQSEAIAACKGMWKWYHLITNNQWMTIARNIEANNQNWSSGTIWAGNIYNGVSNDLINGCDSEWWNLDPRSSGTKTGPWNITCNNKRSHKLKQWGWVIWDFSWNIWEHVNKANTLEGTWYNVAQTSLAWSSSLTSWDSDGIYGDDMQRYGSATSWWMTQGLWSIYYAQWVLDNVFLRGGTAFDSSNTGIFTLFLSYTSTTEHRSVGFRCAFK